MIAGLKLNEIKSVIKMGGILMKGVIWKGRPRRFAVRCFYNR
jgi:hypothetical protein